MKKDGTTTRSYKMNWFLFVLVFLFFFLWLDLVRNPVNPKQDLLVELKIENERLEKDLLQARIAYVNTEVKRVEEELKREKCYE